MKRDFAASKSAFSSINRPSVVSSSESKASVFAAQLRQYLLDDFLPLLTGIATVEQIRYRSFLPPQGRLIRPDILAKPFVNLL